MKAGAIPSEVLIVGGLLVLVGGYIYLKGFSGAAKSVTKAAVNTASGAAAGVVVGAGNIVGIPDTSNAQCEADIAAGNTLAASFSCPLPRFATYLTTGK